jgi:hypothetical protein
MSLRVFVASCPDLTDARIFALTHPRTGAAVQFVRAGDALLEVHRFRDGAIPRSWLLGGQMEMVLEDGSLLLATQFDPLFLLLSHLDRNRFTPLGDALSGPHAAALEQHVASLPGIQRRLASVCDVKDIDDESYVRLSDAKLLEWLRRKTDALARHLQESKLVGAAPAAAAAAAASLGQFDEPAAANPESGNPGNPASEAGIEAQAKLLSLSLVCDCLPAGAEQAALLASYSVTAEAVATTRKGSCKAAKPAGHVEAPSWHAEIEGKDAFSGGGGATAPASAPTQEPPSKKAKVVSTAAKTSAAKNASTASKKGQTSMASFFGAPKKK